MYLEIQFRKLISFNFKRYSYYFFTIKPNHSVALYDNAHDMVKLIEYVNKVMTKSKINQMVYAFELDSKKRLHIHGIAQAVEDIRYDKLYRDWGVHHKFYQIFVVTTEKQIWNIILYINKDPIGPIIKAFKEEGTFTYIDNLAYWFKRKCLIKNDTPKNAVDVLTELTRNTLDI